MNIRRGKLYVVLYIVTALMFVLPLVELLVSSLISALPIRVGTLQWRFGLVGLFGSNFLIPMMGLTAIALTAALFEHRIVLRVVATIALVVALVALSGELIFALDALQLRRSVRPQAQRMFDFSAAKAMIGLVCVMVVSGWIGIAGWKASLAGDRARRAAETKRAKTPVLIAAAAANAPRPVEALEKAGV